MSIHPLSQWSLGLTNILETTFRRVNNVDQITYFASNFIFWWEILAFKKLLGLEVFYTVQYLYFNVVGAFS